MGFEEKVYNPGHHIRVVTATSLFDGHDASINIMRRILQDTGAEVIHLGHNRSVQEIVTAAVEAAISCLITAQCGANLIHDIGYLEYGLTGSFEMRR